MRELACFIIEWIFTYYKLWFVLFIYFQGRIRLLNTDIGLYFKWNIDENGLPKDCGIFDKVERTDKAFRKSSDLGISDCPKTDIRANGGKTKKLWEVADEYALNQGKWMTDFRNVFAKMQSKGSVELTDVPNNFWSHECGKLYLLLRPLNYQVNQ